MSRTEHLDQADIDASIARERAPNHVLVPKPSIQRQFDILTQGRPMAHEQLQYLAEHDALLSLEGINRVLSIFMSEPEDTVDL